MKKFNSFTIKNWLKNAKEIAAQFIIPFVVFQGIRTVLLPSTFDILFLAILILIALAYQFEWI